MILLLILFSAVLISVVYLQLDNNNLDDRSKVIYINLIIPILVITLLFFSNSYIILGLLSSVALSFVLVYRELLSNFVNTLFLYLYPPEWKIGDELYFVDKDIRLKYNGVGFLRTKLYYTDEKNKGNTMLIPNRELASEKISIHRSI